MGGWAWLFVLATSAQGGDRPTYMAVGGGVEDVYGPTEDDPYDIYEGDECCWDIGYMWTSRLRVSTILLDKALVGLSLNTLGFRFDKKDLDLAAILGHPTLYVTFEQYRQRGRSPIGAFERKGTATAIEWAPYDIDIIQSLTLKYQRERGPFDSEWASYNERWSLSWNDIDAWEGALRGNEPDFLCDRVNSSAYVCMGIATELGWIRSTPSYLELEVYGNSSRLRRGPEFYGYMRNELRAQLVIWDEYLPFAFNIDALGGTEVSKAYGLDNHLFWGADANLAFRL